MKLKIQDIRKRDVPSQFGGVWTIYSAKFEGVENPQFGYDLAGFGKSAERLKAGDTVVGYITTKNYNDKKTGQLRTAYTFNKVSAEYVYGLILKMNPEIENIGNDKLAPPPKVDAATPGWDSQDVPGDEGETVQW